MDKVKDFIKRWNYKFPVDYWWRKKHEVAFNSQEHRNSNFWDQVAEYHEDVMYQKLKEENTYDPTENDWLNIKENKVISVEEGIENAMSEIEKFKQELNK